MRRIGVFALVLPVGALLISCTTSLRKPTINAPTKSATGVPSQTPTSTTTAELQTTETAQVLQGPEVSYQGVHFFLDPAMGSRIYVFHDVITLDGLTAHSTRFALTAEEQCMTWCLEIYPVSEFEQAFGFFVFPPAGYRGGAAVIFTAQEKELSLPYGSGSRALETFGQNHYGVSNESLRYVFRGYTANRQYAIFLQAPIHAPGLPDAAPTMTTGSDPAKDILAYNKDAADSMNALSSADFSPNLGLLDRLVMSLQVDTQ